MSELNCFLLSQILIIFTLPANHLRRYHRLFFIGVQLLYTTASVFAVKQSESVVSIVYMCQSQSPSSSHAAPIIDFLYDSNIPQGTPSPVLICGLCQILLFDEFNGGKLMKQERENTGSVFAALLFYFSFSLPLMTRSM